MANRRAALKSFVAVSPFFIVFTLAMLRPLFFYGYVKTLAININNKPHVIGKHPLFLKSTGAVQYFKCFIYCVYQLAPYPVCAVSIVCHCVAPVSGYKVKVTCCSYNLPQHQRGYHLCTVALFLHHCHHVGRLPVCNQLLCSCHHKCGAGFWC